MFKMFVKPYSSDPEAELAAAKARGDVLDTPPAGDDKKPPVEDAKNGEKTPKTPVEDVKSDDLETEEEKAEREAEEARVKEKEEREKRIRIPKSRYDEAQLKARQREAALQARIQQLEQSVGAKKTDEEFSTLQKSVRELRDKYEDLLLEGKKDEARKTRVDLEAAQDKLTDYKAAATSHAARREAIDGLRYEETLAKLEQAYPVLNPDDADEFDEDKATEVSDLMNALMRSQGLMRHAALAKAARYVLGAPATGKNVDGEDAKKQREIDARKKAADAAKRQPADTGKVGKDSDKDGGKGTGEIDVLKLSKSAFDKLSEERLAALRGDEVTS